MIWRLFGQDVLAGETPHPLAIDDVWKNSYSENTSRKVWAAKYTGRHPNLVALELSSFKCGHDAPIYTVIEEVVEHTGTPYFCFKDIDENKPSGSIRIRVETIGYFLKRYREDMVREKQKKVAIDEQLKKFEEQLRLEMMTAEKYKHVEAPQAPADALVHIGNAQIGNTQPESRELVEMSGD